MEEGSVREVDFREFAKKKYIKPRDRILEFGPLIRPTVTKKTHPNVYYADIRSTEDIKRLYTSNDYLKSTGLKVDINQVVDIDYVIKDSYKKTFKNVEKFDVVMLSHVIEHIPDIIDFFIDIKNVLKKDGRLIIVYPDAEYCFDHFRNGSTFIDAYDVYKNDNAFSKRVFDFVYNVVQENNPLYFWKDENQNSIIPRNDFNNALKAYERSKEGTLPDDTHFWPFSNYQLIKFLYDMDRADLLSFDIEKFYPTPEGSQECMLVLSLKKKPGLKHDLYQKIFSEISPTTKAIKASQQVERLEKDIKSLGSHNEQLRLDNKQMKDELNSIYSSKKWKYAHRLGSVKNRLTKR